MDLLPPPPPPPGPPPPLSQDSISNSSNGNTSTNNMAITKVMTNSFVSAVGDMLMKTIIEPVDKGKIDNGDSSSDDGDDSSSDSSSDDSDSSNDDSDSNSDNNDSSDDSSDDDDNDNNDNNDNNNDKSTGYYVDLFKNKVDPSYMCGICKKCLKTPKMIPCNHAFCEECIKKKQHCTAVQCDQYRVTIDCEVDLRDPGKSFLKRLGGLELKCDKCEKEMVLHEYENHMKFECQYRSLPCPYCKEIFGFKELPLHHRTKCIRFPTQCSNFEKGCSSMVPRCEMETHLKEKCAMTMMTCKFIGCEAIVARKDMEQHCNALNSENKHLDNLNDYVIKQQSKLHDQTLAILELNDKNEELETYINILKNGREMKYLLNGIVKEISEEPLELIKLCKLYKRNQPMVWRLFNSLRAYIQNIIEDVENSIHRQNLSSVTAELTTEKEIEKTKAKQMKKLGNSRLKPLFKMKICEVVMDAFTVHQENREVVYHGVGLIWSLLTISNETRILFGDPSTCNIIDIIIETSHYFDEDEEISLIIGIIISYLCKISQNKKLLHESGVQSVITKTMATFPDNIKIQEVFLLCITSLAVDDSRYPEILRRHNICPAIRKTMKDMELELEIQIACCKAIKNLTEDCTASKKIFTSMQQANIMDPLKKALQYYPYETEINIYGIHAIYNLLSNSREICHDVLEENNNNNNNNNNNEICNIIINALKNFRRNSEIQVNCYKTIVYICERSITSKTFLIKRDTSSIIVNALNNFPGQSSILEHGWKAISALNENLQSAPFSVTSSTNNTVVTNDNSDITGYT